MELAGAIGICFSFRDSVCSKGAALVYVSNDPQKEHRHITHSEDIPLIFYETNVSSRKHGRAQVFSHKGMRQSH